jgi:glycosyltransferase involved in cell wall biosynthesis
VLNVFDEGIFEYSWTQKFKALAAVLAYNQKLMQLVEEHGSRRIWTRNLKGVLMSGWAASRLGVPLIWDMGYEKSLRGVKQLLHWIGFGLVTDIITQSERQFSETFGAWAERLVGYKVSHIYPGIDTERQSLLQDAAEKHTGEKRTVLTIGNIHPRKNQAMTIRAMAPLLRSKPDLRLVIAGAVRDKEYRDELRVLVDERNVTESVHFLGWRDDIPTLLGQSDLLILSSRREGIPHVVREAMFAQVPVVATRVGGVPESVRHGETGYLVEPDDCDNLRKRAQELLEDSNLRGKMGMNAAEFARRRFSNSAWIEAYANVLEAT